MDFDFQPALDFYSSLRKKGKNRKEALELALNKFDLMRPGIHNEFEKLIEEEIEPGIEAREWVAKEQKEIHRHDLTPPAITEVLTEKEEVEDKMEPWCKGAWDSWKKR